MIAIMTTGQRTYFVDGGKFDIDEMRSILTQGRRGDLIFGFADAIAFEGDLKSVPIATLLDPDRVGALDGIAKEKLQWFIAELKKNYGDYSTKDLEVRLAL